MFISHTAGGRLWLVVLFFLFSATGFSNPVKAGKSYRAGPISQSSKVFEDRGSILEPNRVKRALLVAVSKYKKKVTNGTPWNDLNDGPGDDVELLASILINRFRFKPENVKIISDRPVSLNGKTVEPVTPTAELITNTFSSFLTNQTKPGDVVFFHFSGHGQQVPDDGTDELDGYDETLVPFDYESQTSEKNLLRDDKIGKLLEELSARGPSNITVSIDTCFSGTATRGDFDESRGGPWLGTPVPRDKIKGDDENLNDAIAHKTASGTQALKNYVFLSATNSGQRALPIIKGGKTYGVFSYYLSAALENSDSTTTYRDIYERVLREVNIGRDQRPQMEGDQIDNIVFTDGALIPESYIPVTVNADLEKPGRYKVILSAGSLQGITAGSKFDLYPQSTKSRKEGPPPVKSKVTQVRATYSLLEPETSASPELLKNMARAFETLHNYENVLKVALKNANNVWGLNEMLGKLGLVTFREETDREWNVMVRAAVQSDRDEKVVPEDFKGVILQRREGRSIFARIGEDQNLAENVRKALITEARRITLMSLPSPNVNIKIEMRLVPINVEWHLEARGNARVDKYIGDKKEGLAYSKSGNIEFQLNDWYRVEVRNVSITDTAVYVTLLNMDAGGKIVPLFPVQGRENLIKRAGNPLNKNDGWIPVNDVYVRIILPTGLESVWAIATTEKTDFSPLFDQGIIAQGASRGASFSDALLKEVENRKMSTERGGTEAAEKLLTAINSPPGQIFIATQEGNDVRGPSAGASRLSWATASTSYMVVEK